VLSLAAVGPAGAFGAGSMEARRRCFEARGEAAMVACRQALRPGLAKGAAAAVRQALLDALVERGRFDEIVEVVRQAALADPGDAEAQLALGSALLHFAGNASEAVAALQASLHLRDGDARAYGELGVALHRLGQHAEAVAAFAQAERLDADYFEGRPAARAGYEASKTGQSWP
jgi:Flp pilus assembly protein TadD